MLIEEEFRGAANLPRINLERRHQVGATHVAAQPDTIVWLKATRSISKTLHENRGRRGNSLYLPSHPAEFLSSSTVRAETNRIQAPNTLTTAHGNDRQPGRRICGSRPQRAESSPLETSIRSCRLLILWWPGTGLNRRRRPFQGRALPLSYLASVQTFSCISCAESGSAGEGWAAPRSVRCNDLGSIPIDNRARQTLSVHEGRSCETATRWRCFP